MRMVSVLIGIGFLIILVGALAINHTFTKKGDTVVNTINSSSSTPMASTLSLTSSAFADGASIPSKYTCDGGPPTGGFNPPLSIKDVPASTCSLVLIMDDPDVPKQVKPDGVFVHWVLFNIPATTSEIPEGDLPTGAVAGANGAGKNAYTGPCPPSQYEPSEHRYFFKLYALDAMLPLKLGATKDDVEKAMQGHIIGQTQLLGRYKKISD